MGEVRWDIADRGHGVASGRVFGANVDELPVAMRDPGRVAEEGEVHRLPHQRSPYAEAHARLRTASVAPEGKIFVVELQTREDGVSGPVVFTDLVEVAAKHA